MSIFRRNGQPAKVPDPHSHQVVLSQRRNAAHATVGELQARIEALTDEHGASLLEGRFDDHVAAAEELESTRVELGRAEAAHAALAETEQAVSRECQRLDREVRIGECERVRDAAAERCQQKLADLPVMIAELQEMARVALRDEQELQAASLEAQGLRHSLVHFDDPSYGVPRFNAPAPVSTAFEYHPEYRSLANGNWFTGVVGGGAR